MINLKNKKQNKIAQKENEGVKNMKNQNVTQEKQFAHKLSTAYQQNLIELFGYIYMEPNKHTKEDLAEIFTKNGKSNERKIIRMVEDINTLCPYIKRTIFDFDGRTHYSIVERFSESDLDTFYKKANNAAVLYIFLKAIFFRPMSTKTIMDTTKVNKKTANKIINAILDSTYLVDEIETEDGHIIGHPRYFEYQN